ALSDGGSRFLLVVLGEEVGEVTLRVPGRHNVENALAAAAAAMAVGAAPREIAGALSTFRGIARRTEYRGSLRGVSYFEDYAHHPTAIRAAAEALRGEEGRLILVYQPHTFSRTAGFFSEMAGALGVADLPILVDTYAAREAADANATSRALAKAIGGVTVGTPECAALYVRANARPGDRVVVMGAGDLGPRFFVGELSFTGD
ncbi:MAG: UDP-N-acetylmuramate--L-alanine ligase, partial [Clostridia bacterium]|nr:UDP-N-acetylmuramate--L-alanine ligase [Clostridia bacterium]